MTSNDTTRNIVEATQHADDWAQAAFDAMKQYKAELFATVEADDTADAVTDKAKLFKAATDLHNAANRVQQLVEQARQQREGMDASVAQIVATGIALAEAVDARHDAADRLSNVLHYTNR